MAILKNLGAAFSLKACYSWVALFFACFAIHAQSRVFVSVGVTNSLGGNFSTYAAKTPSNWAADLEWDIKVMGSLYLVSGLSTFGVGYSSTQNLLVPSNSDYSARYLSVPLMARWNVGNRNYLYIDFGINTLYLAQAHLHESKDKFNNGTFVSYDGDIAPYLNRFFQSFKVQETVAFNRFTISLFFIIQSRGQGTINNLADHWALNAQQSTFLSSNGYSDFFLGGFKFGCRIR